MRLITFLAFSVGLAVAAPAGMNSPPKDAAKREWLDGYGGGGGGGYGGGGGGGYGGGGRGGYGLDDDDDDGSDVAKRSAKREWLDGYGGGNGGYGGGGGGYGPSDEIE